MFEPLIYSAAWWGDSSSETYSCQIVPKLLTAVHKSDHIFGTNCMPTDLSCNLPRSIIVWEQSIIMECPFRPIKLSIIMRYIRTSSGETLFISSNNQSRWAFKTKETVTECDTILIKTTEGLYLAPEDYKFENITSAKMELTLYDDKSEIGIQLAGTDYNIIEEKEIENDLLMKECKLLRNAIQLFSFHHRKFFKVTDLENSDAVLVQSEQVSMQQTINQMKNCPEVVLVKISSQSMLSAMILIWGILIVS